MSYVEKSEFDEYRTTQQGRDQVRDEKHRDLQDQLQMMLATIEEMQEAARQEGARAKKAWQRSKLRSPSFAIKESNRKKDHERFGRRWTV